MLTELVRNNVLVDNYQLKPHGGHVVALIKRDEKYTVSCLLLYCRMVGNGG